MPKRTKVFVEELIHHVHTRVGVVRRRREDPGCAGQLGERDRRLAASLGK